MFAMQHPETLRRAVDVADMFRTMVQYSLTGLNNVAPLIVSTAPSKAIERPVKILTFMIARKVQVVRVFKGRLAKAEHVKLIELLMAIHGTVTYECCTFRFAQTSDSGGGAASSAASSANAIARRQSLATGVENLLPKLRPELDKLLGASNPDPSAGVGGSGARGDAGFTDSSYAEFAWGLCQQLADSSSSSSGGSSSGGGSNLSTNASPLAMALGRVELLVSTACNSK